MVRGVNVIYCDLVRDKLIRDFLALVRPDEHLDPARLQQHRLPVHHGGWAARVEPQDCQGRGQQLVEETLEREPDVLAQSLPAWVL